MENSDSNCLGFKGSYQEIETPIFCDEAKSEYGISVRHSKMLTNNELRFRMNAEDGSAYIRTVTTKESQGWQNAHYHKHLRETYLVEKGWIGYVEKLNDKIVFKKFKSGELFTTIPLVAHNIYMPANAVIHTVKHSANKELTETDWFGDGNDCKQIHTAISKKSFKKVDYDGFPTTAEPEKPVKQELYNEAYRHFDTLIWQVPAWSSALFAAVIAIIGAVFGIDSESVFFSEFIPQNVLVSILLLFFGLFTLALSYALYRFRWHQSNVKPWGGRLISPQFFLQLLVSIEAAILLVGALVFLSIELTYPVSVIIALIAGISTYYEAKLLTKTKADSHTGLSESSNHGSSFTSDVIKQKGS
ncbi:hypothetical protein GYB29_10590 [bacterium]|jgi:hypothetical protein|nr:hypothetical protein [Balneola sp.]MBR9918107.1 hypothetical protein [bacterium]